MATGQNVNETGAESPWFTTTHWSVVLNAGQQSSPASQAVLEQLCRAYWYPLYAYLRRAGHNETDAQDLIQSFFESLIEREWVAAADSTKGRFRSFLLVCLNRFVSGQARRENARKRGGGRVLVSLDDEDAAGRYALEQVEELAPERVYDRRWALTLLEQAWDRLREECRTTGKLPLFDHLRATQDAEAQSHEQMAARLGMTESALKSALFWLRARYREILREEVAQTVNDPSDVDEEIRYLLQVVATCS